MSASVELLTDKTYEEIKDEGIKEGIKEGREEEGLKRQLAYLRDVLYYRFGVEPDETAPLLANKSLDELDALAETPRSCASYEEFRERL